MGFNFQAAHASRVLDDDAAMAVIDHLQSEIPDRVPLGEGVEYFCIGDELGWSWWKELQQYALERVGPEKSKQISAIDACHGVYIDAKIDRFVLWPNGKEQHDESEATTPERLARTPWYLRPLQWIGLYRRGGLSPEILEQIRAMVKDLGSRPGEEGSLQVGNLRVLHAELSSLLNELGTEQTEQAVEALRLSYSQNDDRIDDDPAIQCLCHAWLTSRYALAHGAPMWLIK